MRSHFQEVTACQISPKPFNYKHATSLATQHTLNNKQGITGGGGSAAAGPACPPACPPTAD